MNPARARRRVINYVIAVLLLAVPIAFLRANLKSPATVNWFDRGVLKVSSPLQKGAAWVIDGVMSAWHHYVWLVDVEEENDELRRENERLRRALADASRQAREAADLEALVDVRARTPSETIGARVVAASTNPYFRVSRIALDRGKGEVTSGMAVLAAEGVVGRIERVYASYADVLLAVDPQSKIDVVVPRTGSRGVLTGLGAANGYACKIDYLLRGEEVKEGDSVVTSGLGGVFPRDVPVGRIHKIEKTEYGLYQDVEVVPVVDFSRLSTVLVVLAPPPPPDPTGDAKKSPEPAFGMVPR